MASARSQLRHCIPARSSHDSRLPAEARGGAGLPWPRPMPRPRGKVSCVGAAAGIAEQGAQSRVAPSSADLRVSAPAGCQVLLGAAEATGEGG